MGKPTGFLETERVENPYRETSQRLNDYQDLHCPQGTECRRAQASRCVGCGVPFCQSDYGCPLHNLIPEWNDLIWRGHDKAALSRLLETAPFPEFTGRVCPGLCEKACNLADDSVTNRDNELYLIETGFNNGWVKPRLPSKRLNKTVAVVGSGPSGLAAADLLNRMGFDVTVIEKADRPGGLLMYGIPNMKLPKEIVARRIALMEKEGVSFRCGEEAGPDLPDAYDAVVLCGGSRKPRPLSVKGADAKGVCFAVDYLTAATRSILQSEESPLCAYGLDVIVVGGGDTGNDCVGTALRQHCRSIVQLEMMGAPPVTRTVSNPWPEWPRTLRTDYGQLEAMAVQGQDPRVYNTTVKEILTDETGRITAAVTVRLQRNMDGKFVPVEGSELTLPCGLMLIAAGFIGCEEKTLLSFGQSADQRGRLMPADGTHHLGGKLFSAGDMRTGQSLVVRAIADGRAAALEVAACLQV